MGGRCGVYPDWWSIFTYDGLIMFYYLISGGATAALRAFTPPHYTIKTRSIITIPKFEHRSGQFWPIISGEQTISCQTSSGVYLPAAVQTEFRYIRCHCGCTGVVISRNTTVFIPPFWARSTLFCRALWENTSPQHHVKVTAGDAWAPGPRSHPPSYFSTLVETFILRKKKKKGVRGW